MLGSMVTGFLPNTVMSLATCLASSAGLGSACTPIITRKSKDVGR
jgi:hypothetical protein